MKELTNEFLLFEGKTMFLPQDILFLPSPPKYLLVLVTLPIN